MRRPFAIAVLSLMAAAVFSSTAVLAHDPGEDLRAPNGKKGPPQEIDAPRDFAALLRHQVDVLGLRAGPELALPAIQREVITGDVAHYTLTIPTGPGKYDRIRVHRVVREARAGRPIKTVRNLFYQHGDLKDFVGMALPGLYEPSLARDFGFATFLARNNVDVWGIDQDWTLVPESEAEVSFMSTWGLGRARDNLALGIAVARVMRLATGSGGGPMLLAGYSSGCFQSAALLNDEVRLPAWLRQVNGYVNVDVPLKAGDPGVAGTFRADLAVQNAAIEAGQYGSFLPFKTFAQLAITAPDDPSPFAEGLSNFQLVAYLTLTPGGIGWPDLQFWAGTDPDASGIPTKPRLTSKEAWLQFLESAIVWQPVRYFKEYDEFGLAPLDGLSSPFDDDLGQVTVPVLSVSAGGSFGSRNDYGIGQFGSTDVRTILVTTGSEPAIDAGHVDLFTWQGSQDQFWRPLLDWIRGNSSGFRSGEAPGIMANGPAVGGDEPLVTEQAAVEFGLRPVASNPVHGPFDVAFALPASGPARLEVLDVAGRLVEEQDVAARGGLQHARLGDSSRLAPGVYLVRLSQADRQWARRVAVVSGR